MSNEIPASAQTMVKASDQKFCHACATPIHVSASMCPKCGAHQQATVSGGLGQSAANPASAFTNPQIQQRTTADQQYCHGCGHIIHVSAPTCPRCGARQPGQSATSAISNGATKSRVTAAVLAFLLGGLGVHKFYCGKIGLGFLYLVFFWTWIPALIALVEGILFLTGSSTDEEFTQKYCA